MPSRVLILFLAILMAGTTSCTGGQSPTTEVTPVEAPDVIRVASSAFREGQPIPEQFTCDGGGQIPPLSWDGVPEGANALALVVDDPDAPRGTFVHWVVLDMPVDTRGLDAGAVPRGAVEATNSAGQASWFPPCPPSGTHRYRFTVYALSDRTGLPGGAGLDRALRVVGSTATARGRLVGTYARRG